MLIKTLMEDHYMTAFPQEKLVAKQKKMKSSLPQNRVFMDMSAAQIFRANRYKKLRQASVVKFDYETTRLLQHFTESLFSAVNDKAKLMQLCGLPRDLPVFYELELIYNNNEKKSFTTGLLLQKIETDVCVEQYRPTGATLLDPVVTINVTDTDHTLIPNDHMAPFVKSMSEEFDHPKEQIEATEGDAALNIAMTCAVYRALSRLAPELFKQDFKGLFSRLERMRIKRLTGERHNDGKLVTVTLSKDGKEVLSDLKRTLTTLKDGEIPELAMKLIADNDKLHWIPKPLVAA